jgi:hypothetical protein
MLVVYKAKGGEMSRGDETKYREVEPSYFDFGGGGRDYGSFAA